MMRLSKDEQTKIQTLRNPRTNLEDTLKVEKESTFPNSAVVGFVEQRRTNLN